MAVVIQKKTVHELSVRISAMSFAMKDIISQNQINRLRLHCKGFARLPHFPLYTVTVRGLFLAARAC